MFQKNNDICASFQHKEYDMKHLKTFTAIGLAVAALSSNAFANDFPSKPITIVVPFAAGGTTDIIARVISEPLGKELGQAVIIENRGGAGGIIGASETSRAKPDGYSLGIATLSSHATNPAINPAGTKYDPINDFTFIGNVAGTPNVIAVTKSYPANNYKEFEAEIKKNGDKQSYASSGTGGVQHLLMELYKNLTKTNMQHIPYKGAGPALNDTVAGQVQMNLDNLPSSLPFIKDGRLKAMVVAAPKRLSVLPDVPTFAEVGLAPVNKMAVYGILGPKNMDKDVVIKINTALNKVLKDPAVIKRIEDTGSIVTPTTPDDFKQLFVQEFDVYKKVVKDNKLSLE